MRCKTAAVGALHQLAVNYWTDPTVSPPPVQAQAYGVISTADALPPWVQLASGQVSSTGHSLVPSESLPAQLDQIKQQAACMADIVAKGLNFFLQEWCKCVSSTQVASLRRLQSPNPRRRSIGSPAGTIEEEPEEYPGRSTLLSIFAAFDAAFEVLEERRQIKSLMTPPNTLIGTARLGCTQKENVVILKNNPVTVD